MSATHRAAILHAPGQPLSIQDVETHHPKPNEVLIRNYALAIQPLDAKMFISNYGPAASLNFPAVLGSSGAGIVDKVGSKAMNLRVGDRVVFDTKAYVSPNANFQQGAWQELVICSAGTVAKQAVLTSFPLQTAVAALHVFLGMSAPPLTSSVSPSPGLKDEKVLIWGAGGAVGQYAVQYAASVGHTVICTASPRSTTYLTQLGASAVIDYKAADVLSQLCALGPFKYLMTASGDASSQQTIAELLRPSGGKFASVLPLSAGVELPSNVEVIYTAFSQAAQKDEYTEWRKWWYTSYLPSVLSSGSVSPVSYTHIEGGLSALQNASQDVFDGKVRGKVVISPQE
ncbi:oxidoreductase domain-containing protein [Macroventuria anomochaeta]|uniref:Oxidoreductase domain-containing protein n=1 Tax=Macroventuria anomochaeta TaxID=301207 RepID=A0ACB6RNE7_9PLEO|nr:oxidoreductase domain-containing protein [Macroventuria anomochaeta]KAF2622462.1 oxidoreductase domain-containing protein [Macroventuria anomochaeta]